MVFHSHRFHRVDTVGGDFAYQDSNDFDPDSVAFCPYCWGVRKAKVALPSSGESGYAVCHVCRSATQLHMPNDMDFFFAGED
jgi:hypothetical protein